MLALLIVNYFDLINNDLITIRTFFRFKIKLKLLETSIFVHACKFKSCFKLKQLHNSSNLEQNFSKFY